LTVRLNLARTLANCAANGPGERFVVWVQGCPLRCPGCWNPDTWPFAPRQVREVDDLANEILATDGIDGVTFTGGEPFVQALALSEVARQVRQAGLSIFVFTGYDLDELTGSAARSLLGQVDVLVAGPYRLEERTLDLTWRGSANQQVHFLTDRYGPTDLVATATIEVRIEANGSITLTGFPRPGLLEDIG
jgi:anaerobic ribonucleoside-triphosphate reductase activating protein